MNVTNGLIGGIDTTDNLFGRFHALKAFGVNFVFKYCVPTRAFPTKAWSSSEVDGAVAVGIKRGHLFERLASIDEFTIGQAEEDAVNALGAMICDRVAVGKVCVFCVDFDATEEEANGPILDYFSAVHRRFIPTGYLVGVYGSGLVCSIVKGAGVAHCSMLAQSVGWQGSETYQDWDFKQLLEVAPMKLNADCLLAKPSALQFLS